MLLRDATQPVAPPKRPRVRPQFLILEDVVPKDDLAQMVDVGTRWHGLTQEELPKPLHRTGAPAFSTPEESPPGPNYVRAAAPFASSLEAHRSGCMT